MVHVGRMSMAPNISSTVIHGNTLLGAHDERLLQSGLFHLDSNSYVVTVLFCVVAQSTVFGSLT